MNAGTMKCVCLLSQVAGLYCPCFINMAAKSHEKHVENRSLCIGHKKIKRIVWVDTEGSEITGTKQPEDQKKKNDIYINK